MQLSLALCRRILCPQDKLRLSPPNEANSIATMTSIATSQPRTSASPIGATDRLAGQIRSVRRARRRQPTTTRSSTSSSRAAKSGLPAAVSLHAVHAIVESIRDPELLAKVNRFDAVLPDGQPVRWALNHLTASACGSACTDRS